MRAAITTILSLVGGAGDIVGSILQYKLAKDLQEEALKDKAEGKAGMEALLLNRQQGYNDIWKMIYGGVSNFDFSQITTPGIDMNAGGPTRGGTDPNDPRDKEGRDYEYGPRPESRSGYTKTGSDEYKEKLKKTHSRSTSITGGS